MWKWHWNNWSASQHIGDKEGIVFITMLLYDIIENHDTVYFRSPFKKVSSLPMAVDMLLHKADVLLLEETSMFMRYTTVWSNKWCRSILIQCFRFGRRPIMVIAGVLNIGVGIASAFMPNYLSFVASRFLLAVLTTGRENAAAVLGWDFWHCLTHPYFFLL